MWIEVKPVLLAAKYEGGRLFFPPKAGEELVYKHLYIVDEKAPKKGAKWLYHPQAGLHQPINGCDVSSCHAVVATTDPKLIVDGVPSISKKFLKQFVSLNGKGQIMMEMEQYCTIKPKYTTDFSFKLDISKPGEFEPKLNKSGNAILSIVPETDLKKVAEKLNDKVLFPEQVEGIKGKIIEDKADPIKEAAENYIRSIIMAGNMPTEEHIKLALPLYMPLFKAGWEANPAKWTDEDMVMFASKCSFNMDENATYSDILIEYEKEKDYQK